ncbi:MAG: hypothetical protein IJI61_09065 [Oscillospiraceae bacterium]|nr:hypothetical protein [Oscillospiraceae bacterium]
MHRNERKIARSVFYVLLLAAYLAFHLLILTRHEAFRDEAQAWTLARNTTLGELFADLCIEGHPCLWFLIIRPFAKLGLSYRYFGGISLVFMGISAALLLWKAPFPLPLRILTLFSFAFCYNSPVMPRTYCVITLLILLLAILWPDRTKKSLLYGTLIALLFQSHIILAGFAGGLVLELFLQWMKDRRKDGKLFCGILLPCLSALATAFELHQRSDVPKFVDSTASSLLEKLNFDPQTILNSIYDLEETVWGHYVCEAEIGPVTGKTLLLLVFFLLLLALVTAVSRCRAWSGSFGIFLVGLCGFGFALGVRLFIYAGGYHMMVCYFLMLIFLVWTVFATLDEKSIRSISGILLALALLLTCEKVFNAVKYDLSQPFSGSKPTADYIRDNLPEGSTLVVKEHYLTPSVTAYTASDRQDITVWSADTKNPYTFHVWGAEYPVLDAEDLVSEVQTQFPGREDLFYLSCAEGVENEHLKLLYSIPERNPLEENYWLYQILP